MFIKTSLIINTKIAAKIKLRNVTFVINNDITKKKKNSISTSGHTSNYKKI
jgi:hypothetical protein